MKRKFTIFAVVAMILVAIAACSKDELGVEVIVPQQEQMDSYRVSVDEALRSAETILRAGDRDTRSAARRVKSTELYVAKPATRSNENTEVSFYLINYEDNAGYALVSTDERTTPVYMYAEDGNITTEAFEEVPPLAIFMEEAIENYEAEVASYGADGPIDIGFPPGVDGRMGILDGVTYYVNVDTTYLTKGPLTTTRWHQFNPYNTYCRNGLVGCLPLAMGQIMAYHQHPSSYGDRTFDWTTMSQTEYDNISDEGAESVAYLLGKIGELGNARYRYANPSQNQSAGTSMRMDSVAYVYNAMGYTLDSLDYFNVNTALQEIDMNRPFIAYGSRWDEEDQQNKAHAWVIHGYRIQYTIVRYLYTEPPYLEYTRREYTTRYLRSNVGWRSTDTETYYDYYSLSSDLIYPDNNLMITNIRPNN